MGAASHSRSHRAALVTLGSQTLSQSQPPRCGQKTSNLVYRDLNCFLVMKADSVLNLFHWHHLQQMPCSILLTSGLTHSRGGSWSGGTWGWDAGRACTCLWPKSMCRKHMDHLQPWRAFLHHWPHPSLPKSPEDSRSPQVTTKTKSPAHVPPPTGCPTFFKSLHIQPTNTQAWLTGFKRGSIRKKLRRGQSSMVPFSTLCSHTLRPFYSLLVFPSFFPRIARMICSEQRQVYRLADTSALWNFN